MTTAGRSLPWDWYPGVVPANVVVDETAYVETSFSFHLYRSAEPVGAVPHPNLLTQPAMSPSLLPLAA